MNQNHIKGLGLRTIRNKKIIKMTIERKIKINEEHLIFLENYKVYGFHNSDEMIIRALELLKQEVELKKKIENSADLYAEIYDSDEETKEWTESSMKDWD